MSVTTTDQFVFFHGGWPSQWAKFDFVVEQVPYNCAEQYMMAEKARVFGDDDALAQILNTPNPRQQKALGRRVTGFDADAWNSVCRGIVFTGNLARFEQNPELRQQLLDTGDRLLVEASPRDRIWGIGLGAKNPDASDSTRWRGKNWLGIALTQVRDELHRRAGNPAPPVDPELQAQLDARAEHATPRNT